VSGVGVLFFVRVFSFATSSHFCFVLCRFLSGFGGRRFMVKVTAAATLKHGCLRLIQFKSASAVDYLHSYYHVVEFN